MENMKWITILNIIARSIFTVLIFVFVHKESDYLNVAIINSLGSIVAGIISLIIVFKNFKIKFILPKFENVKYQLKEGWHIFISNIAISLYTISNTFILGLFTNNTIVGYYSGAEKIIKAVQGLITPISQTIYPYLSKLATDSKEKALNFLSRLLKLVGSISFIVSILIFILAGPIVNIILGSKYQESILPLRILAFIPFIAVLSNVFAIQGLYNFGKQAIVSKYVVIIALLHLAYLTFFIHLYQAIGVAISWTITEILITITSFYYFNKVIKQDKNYT